MNCIIKLHIIVHIARQRLRKHVPTRSSRGCCVFCGVCATQQYRGCVFCACTMPNVYNRRGKSLGVVELRSSKGAVVWLEVVEGIRLCQEDLGTLHVL
jgi:hypothetical protein